MMCIRDKHGRRIEPGDLLKTYHFQHANRRLGKAYLYHVAAEIDGLMWAVPVEELDPSHKAANQGGRCLLKYLGPDTEIINGLGRPGSMNYFREREMVKTNA